MLTPTLLAAMIAALILLVQHYALLPYWKQTRRADMPVLVRYIIGTAALMGPTWGVYLEMGDWSAIAVQATITIIGGTAVIVAYALDWLMDLWSARGER